jgi:hypothetical protein
MPVTSSLEKARSVCVRTLPCDAMARLSAVIASSFGASNVTTTSYLPIVQ